MWTTEDNCYFLRDLCLLPMLLNLLTERNIIFLMLLASVLIVPLSFLILVMCFFFLFPLLVLLGVYHQKNIFKESIIGLANFLYCTYVFYFIYLLPLWYLVFIFLSLYLLLLLFTLLVYLSISLLWNNIRFTETMQRQYKEYLYTFHSVFLNVNIL